MKTLTLSLAAVALAAATSLAAATARPGLHWGPAQPLGAGTARAWVAVDMDGAPASMGVSLDPAAFESARLGSNADVVLPLPVSSGVRAAGASTREGPAFRVRFDETSRTYVVVLEGLKGVPQAGPAR